MNLPMIPQDKANHAIYGAAIFLVTALLAAHAPIHLALSPAQLGLLAAAAGGAAKELSDYLINRRLARAGLPPTHGVEFLDAAATAGGGAVCYLATVVATVGGPALVLA